MPFILVNASSSSTALEYTSIYHLQIYCPQLTRTPPTLTTWIRSLICKKCCISNVLDGSEDDFLWEDDGEDKDDSDWVTDNDSVMSDDGKSEE